MPLDLYVHVQVEICHDLYIDMFSCACFVTVSETTHKYSLEKPTVFFFFIWPSFYFLLLYGHLYNFVYVESMQNML